MILCLYCPDCHSTSSWQFISYSLVLLQTTNSALTTTVTGELLMPSSGSDQRNLLQQSMHAAHHLFEPAFQRPFQYLSNPACLVNLPKSKWASSGPSCSGCSEIQRLCRSNERLGDHRTRTSTLPRCAIQHEEHHGRVHWNVGRNNVFFPQLLGEKQCPLPMIGSMIASHAEVLIASLHVLSLLGLCFCEVI